MNYNYYLGLGSNVHSRIEYLNRALERLQELGKLIAQSAVYHTSPWGETEQADFLNLVLHMQSEIQPQTMLRQIKRIEQTLGRQERYRWGPREIDIDILLCDQLEISSADLQIPHKYFKLRKFVLLPFCEIAGDLIPPGEQKNIAELLADCSDHSRIEKHQAQL